MNWKQELDQKMLVRLHSLKCENAALKEEVIRLQKALQASELHQKALTTQVALKTSELNKLREVHQPSEHLSWVMAAVQKPKAKDLTANHESLLIDQDQSVSGHQPKAIRPRVLPPRNFGFREAIRKLNSANAEAKELQKT